MRILNIVATLALAATLAGCAAGNLNKLQAAPRKEQIVLPSDIKVQHQHGPLKVQVEVSATAGTYVAVAADKNGTYYLAQGKLIRWKRVWADDQRMENGGIWIPFSSTEPPRLFTAFLKEGQADPSAAIGEKSQEIVNNMQNNPASGVSPSPVAGAVGGAIGGAIVGAIVEASYGDFIFASAIAETAQHDLVVASIKPLPTP